MQWEPIIGLEVHVQLSTKSKLFSRASTAFGAEPNTQACPIDLGMPGVLPVLNGEAVRMAIKFGLSIDARINQRSIFDRKNYFYPDLPKGYQISQHLHPIIGPGSLTIELEDGTQKKINITRAHLEEDAGKTLHEGFDGMAGIDLNRAGIPLLEIVSEPEIRSAKEAVVYLKNLHALVRYLDISDANMQEGSFRCDANVSVRPVGSTKLGTRTEIKNVNSFRFIEKAINYEIERQISILEDGGVIHQETRLYDADKNETRSMRSKEEAHDYRYFPDPDLLPVIVDNVLIQSICDTLPELPWQKRDRFIKEYELSHYDANLLISSRDLANYFEETAKAAAPAPIKLAANWITGDLLGALNKANLDITKSPIQPKQLAQLLQRISDNTISGKIAKSVFESLWNQEGNVDEIINKKGLTQITDESAIEKIIDEVLAANMEQVEQYRAGKEKVYGFLVGQVMKATQGKANPKQLNEMLQKKLKK